MSQFALAFILYYCTLILMAIFNHGVYAFYLYELVYFLNPKIRWWFAGIPTLPYSFIVSTTLIISYVLNSSKYQSNKLRNIPGNTWLILILLSYICGTFWAVDLESHQRFLIELVKLYVILYFAYRLIDSERRLETAFLFYILGAAYIGFEADNVGRDMFGRVEGIGMVDSPDSNTTAAALVPTLPILIYFGWFVGWKYKLLILILAAYIINGLILINSRGAFLGGAVGVLYFILHMGLVKQKLPYQNFMIVFILLVGLTSFIYLADETFWERMSTIEEQAGAESSGSGGRRINFWMATFDMLRDYPLGVGIFGYQFLSHRYLLDESFFQSTDVEGVYIRAVHSIWFQGLSEIGWHGMLFFSLLLLSLKRGVKKARMLATKNGDLKLFYVGVTLEASFLGFLVAGSFIDVFRAQVLYWLILFCFCYVSIVNGKFQNKKYNTQV